MKNLLILALIISSIGMQSCCKKTGYPVAGIRIQYVCLTGSVLVYDIETNRDDYNRVIDTTEIYLSEQNGYTVSLEFEEGENNHILMKADSTSVDSLSNIIFNRDECDAIENFGYKLNGVDKTENEVVFY